MKKENCQLILIQHWKPKEISRKFLCIIITCQCVAWKVALILSCPVQISVPLNFSCVWILFQNVSNQPCYRLGWSSLGYFFDSFLCYYIAFMWFLCASWQCNLTSKVVCICTLFQPAYGTAEDIRHGYLPSKFSLNQFDLCDHVWYHKRTPQKKTPCFAS